MERWEQELTPLSAHLAELVEAELPRLTARHGSIAAVGLFTDADAATLAPAACTTAHLHTLTTADPTLADQWAFLVDEWDLQPGDDDPFAPVMAQVAKVAATVDPDDWVEWVNLVWNWIVDVMRSLDDWFAKTYPDAVVVFHVTDEDIDPETLVEWAELLNPPDRTRRYTKAVRRG
jgi:hypothetical protein